VAETEDPGYVGELLGNGRVGFGCVDRLRLGADSREVGFDRLELGRFWLFPAWLFPAALKFFGHQFTTAVVVRRNFLDWLRRVHSAFAVAFLGNRFLNEILCDRFSTTGSSVAGASC
jgi:hypothetical protein